MRQVFVAQCAAAVPRHDISVFIVAPATTRAVRRSRLFVELLLLLSDDFGPADIPHHLQAAVLQRPATHVPREQVDDTADTDTNGG